jgi:hypothetical protein
VPASRDPETSAAADARFWPLNRPLYGDRSATKH